MLRIVLVLFLCCACAALSRLPSGRSRIAPQISNSLTTLNLFPKFMQSASNSAKVDDLKAKILLESKGTKNGITATVEQREAVAQLVKSLEKENKIKKLTSSDILDGTWKLAYTTNEGSSAGKIGPFVGDVLQIVDLAEKYYVNNVKILSGAVEASLTADWDELSTTKWQVNFKDISLRLFGIKVLDKPFGNVSGIWRMTYLDDSMRILYAIGGKNTVRENLYILIKE